MLLRGKPSPCRQQQGFRGRSCEAACLASWAASSTTSSEGASKANSQSREEPPRWPLHSSSPWEDMNCRFSSMRTTAEMGVSNSCFTSLQKRKGGAVEGWACGAEMHETQGGARAWGWALAGWGADPWCGTPALAPRPPAHDVMRSNRGSGALPGSRSTRTAASRSSVSRGKVGSGSGGSGCGGVVVLLLVVPSKAPRLSELSSGVPLLMLQPCAWVAAAECKGRGLAVAAGASATVCISSGDLSAGIQATHKRSGNMRERTCLLPQAPIPKWPIALRPNAGQQAPPRKAGKLHFALGCVRSAQALDHFQGQTV